MRFRITARAPLLLVETTNRVSNLAELLHDGHPLPACIAELESRSICLRDLPFESMAVICRISSLAEPQQTGIASTAVPTFIMNQGTLAAAWLENTLSMPAESTAVVT